MICGAKLCILLPLSQQVAGHMIYAIAIVLSTLVSLTLQVYAVS